MPKTEKGKPEIVELRDQLDKVIERSRQILQRGKEELVRLGQVGRLRLDLLNYQRQERHTLEELGRTLHQAFHENNIGPGLLDRSMIQLLEKVDSLGARMRECHEKIAEIEGPKPSRGGARATSPRGRKP